MWQQRSGRYRASVGLAVAGAALAILSLALEDELWTNPARHSGHMVGLLLTSLGVLGWLGPYLLWRLAGRLPWRLLRGLARLAAAGAWLLVGLLTCIGFFVFVF
ncbi:hypothetical protein GCM10027048_29500 [Hymenobacter coalescens]